MVASILRELRRLRWKLALAYTLTSATVLTLLVGLLIATVLWLLGSPETQLATVHQWLQPIAVQSAPYLAVEPPDTARLTLLLTRSLQNNALGIDQSATGTEAAPSFELVLTDEAYLLALDSQGRLLASTRRSDEAGIGQPFDSSSLPGLPEFLAGDLEQSYSLLQPELGLVYVAAPIQVEQRHGTLLFVGSGYTQPATQLFELLTFLGSSMAVFTLATGTVGLVFGLLVGHGLTRRLRAIERTTAAWGQGELELRLRDDSADEIGQLSRQLNGMADQLQALIHERQQFAMLDERNRLARDLHDSVKQHVFAASMNLGAAQEMLDLEPQAAASLIGSAAHATELAKRELTDIIHALRPVELQQSGLEQALRSLAQHWAARSGISLSTDLQLAQRLPAEVEAALFRIAQEALANIARHSGAQSANLYLGNNAGRVELRLSDDGRGFDPERVVSGLGLRSMHERAQSIGADLEIRSSEHGSAVCVILPPAREAAPV